MPVKTRTVFYISGFDPNGARWYNKLYREEAQKQAAVSGMPMKVGRAKQDGDHCSTWEIEAEDGGQTVRTRYRFLSWDDIIRDHWPTSIRALYGLAFSNPFNFLRRGVLAKVYRTAWPTFICGMLPTIFLTGAALAVLLGCTLIGITGSALTNLSGWLFACVALLAGAHIFVRIIAELDRRLRIHWLSRVYQFNLIQSERQARGLKERTERFAHLVRSELERSESDEILLVAHSTGCQLAISVVAALLREQEDLTGLSKSLKFVTVGGSIAMLAWDENAGWFRDELSTVADAEELTWFDFSAAQDGACFALRNPVSLVHADLSEDEIERPKVLSIKLADRMSKERIKEIYWDKFAIHFQYLMASEQPAEYDYFAITAGAQTLEERFARRDTARGFKRFESKLWPPPAVGWG